MTYEEDIERRWREAEHKFSLTPSLFEKWTPGQQSAFEVWKNGYLLRMLIFFPTGKGKSKVTLGILYAAGFTKVQVIAPKATYASWREDAATLGMEIRVENVETFRNPKTKYNKLIPLVIDEYHMLGGHSAVGFKKLERGAKMHKAPIIELSATPEYNDAERAYTLCQINDEVKPAPYLQWLYQNCICTPNPFAYYPDVDGFIVGSTVDFLLQKKWTAYIPDDAEWQDIELDIPVPPLNLFETYGLSRRHRRVMNSDMEKRHKRVNLQLIDDEGLIRDEITELITWVLGQYPDRFKWMVFCNHLDVANALYTTILDTGWEPYLITGETKDEDRERIKQEFIDADPEEGSWLIGTTALSTGTDGIDKVCWSMLILDDIVGDNAKRRQLIGRILPRGQDDKKDRLVITAIPVASKL